MFKINPESIQNRFKISPKSIQKSTKICLGGCLGRFLGLLGASWGHLGSKMAPKANISQLNKQNSPLVGVQVGTRIDQKSFQKRFKM